MIEGRVCTKCAVFKLWEFFPRANAQKSGHRPSCSECHRKQNREYAVANSEKNSARGKQWSKDNRATARVRERAYKSRPEQKAKAKAYFSSPSFLLKATEKTMRRKALIKANSTAEKVDYAEILKRDGRVCHICGLDIAEGFLDFDHVKPLSKGGPHSMSNIKPSHSSCNRRKRDRYAD